jgi:hypothetical protein
MRISTDFKDYYDVGMSVGQDQTLIYNRYKKVVEPKKYPFSTFYNTYQKKWQNEDGMYVNLHTIGFCGKVYPVFELNVDPPNHGTKWYNSKDARAKRRFCYSLEEIDQYVQDFFPKQFEDYATKKKYVKRNSWAWHQRRYDFEDFYRVTEENKVGILKVAEKHFIENRCPVWYAKQICTGKYGLDYYKNEIVYNGPIKQLEFFRVFDPYTAFMEISMWLGNQAEPRKPIPHISDETMAEIKGFDGWSFRKLPTKKVKK